MTSSGLIAKGACLFFLFIKPRFYRHFSSYLRIHYFVARGLLNRRTATLRAGRRKALNLAAAAKFQTNCTSKNSRRKRKHK
jgi:hypothetical protein